jgi:hypothetical protein
MYTEAVSDILVFKTNLELKIDVEKAAELLNTQPGILRWNVDCEDVDHVLRIESDHLQPSLVIALITGAGYACEELPD